MRKQAIASGLVAAAMAGLTGCGMPARPEAAAPADSPVTVTRIPRPAEEDRGVADLEAALAKVDQEKLQAEAEKKEAGTATMPKAEDAVGATHVEAPTWSLGMKGVPAIGSNGNEEATTAPASPATAMGADAVTPPTEGGAATAAAPVAVATMPAATMPMQAAEISVDAALMVLRKHVAEHPTLNTELALALLDTAEGKTPDISGKGLAPADQKLLTDLLSGLQASAGMGGAAGDTVGQRAAPLVAMAKKWEETGDLTLPKIALASRVDSFGVFTPVEAKFSQGVKHTVIIYCEVANFVSKPVDVGWYETDLAQQETLITEDKLLVWRPNPEEVVDRSMNQRHDFYLVKKLTIPDNLAVGNYTLEMTVTDHNSGKAASKSIGIEITAQ